MARAWFGRRETVRNLWTTRRPHHCRPLVYFAYLHAFLLFFLYLIWVCVRTKTRPSLPLAAHLHCWCLTAPARADCWATPAVVTHKKCTEQVQVPLLPQELKKTSISLKMRQTLSSPLKPFWCAFFAISEEIKQVITGTSEKWSGGREGTQRRVGVERGK